MTVPVVVVSEPYHNRVGVYGDQNLDFQGWFNSKEYPVRWPLHLLVLPDESVALIHRSGLFIYE